SFLISTLFFQVQIEVIIGGTILFIVGLYDDLRTLGPRSKLFLQLFVALLTISLGIHFHTGLGFVIDVLISVIWIVGLTNAFNLLDNMDGLSSGTAVISSTFIFIHSLFGQQDMDMQLSLIIAGACLGFLIFNYNPAKIFM